MTTPEGAANDAYVKYDIEGRWWDHHAELRRLFAIMSGCRWLGGPNGQTWYIGKARP